MILWIGLLSIIGFVFMGIDKYKAKKQKWRIPEKNLWMIAILGGAFGCFTGMLFFHHKTQHLSFKLGLPILTSLWIFFYIYLS